MKRALFVFMAATFALGFAAWVTAADEPTVVPTDMWLFIRGDANIDGAVDIGDVIDSLNYLFTPGVDDPHCLAAHDANDDNQVDIGDTIYTLDYLFNGGPKPAAPFPSCGFDPTRPGDGPGLPCNEFYLCAPRA